ncbi:hypothetical protein ACTFDJ_08005 [Campylobacter jejuni]
MLPAFKANFETTNYTPIIEYLSEGGLYSGSFRKAFLYDKLSKDGGLNTFVYFELLTRKEQKLARFNLFVAKNGNFTYVNNKNGNNEDYPGFRQLKTIMVLLGVEELDYTNLGSEDIFNKQYEVIYLNELLNKPLILGFGTEEYEDGNRDIKNKIFLDKIFNIKMQSLEEFRENQEPLSIKSFILRHKALQNTQTQNFKPNENQSYNPYGNEVKNNNNEKYIEIGDDDESLPF